MNVKSLRLCVGLLCIVPIFPSGIWMNLSSLPYMPRSVLIFSPVHATFCAYLLSRTCHVLCLSSLPYMPHSVLIFSPVHSTFCAYLLSRTCHVLCLSHLPWSGNHDWLIDWFMLGSSPYSRDAPRPYKQALVPHNLIPAQESPVPIPKFQMAPKLKISMSSESKKGTQIYFFFSLKNPGKQIPSRFPNGGPYGNCDSIY
jgi:hypothetical protein